MFDETVVSDVVLVYGDDNGHGYEYYCNYYPVVACEHVYYTHLVIKTILHFRFPLFFITGCAGSLLMYLLSWHCLLNILIIPQAA